MNTAVSPAGSDTVDLPEDARALARSAAADEAGVPGLIGEYLGAYAEDDVATTARFATTDAAYAGWAWCVTIAIVDDQHPTVSEVVLLPGPGSLIAPVWLPWSERVRAEDLGPGDLLAPVPDDPRLVPAYLQSDDPAVEEVAHELGLGRIRVMSRLGRLEAAERWHDGPFGPESEMARLAPGVCVQCAFYLPVAGSLGAAFGVCGNEMSPADGRAVDAEFGCGAHSEVVLDLGSSGEVPHLDELELDIHTREPVLEEPVVEEAGVAPGNADVHTGEPLVEGSGVALGDLDGHPLEPVVDETGLAPVDADVDTGEPLVEETGVALGNPDRALSEPADSADD